MGATEYHYKRKIEKGQDKKLIAYEETIDYLLRTTVKDKGESEQESKNLTRKGI